MLKVKRVGAFSVFASVLLIVAFAVPSSAAPLRFGAKLTNQTQADDASTCHNKDSDIPSGSICTWVAAEAFENGSHFKAPANGTLRKLRLISCDAGKFTLQLVKMNTAGKFKLIKTGPIIRYHADPRQVDGDDNTFCGGDNGDNYRIQIFNINVAVLKNEFIAVKAAKVGTLHCSGSDMPLYAPALASGQNFRTETGGAGCGLLVNVQYG